MQGPPVGAISERLEPPPVQVLAAPRRRTDRIGPCLAGRGPQLVRSNALRCSSTTWLLYLARFTSVWDPSRIEKDAEPPLGAKSRHTGLVEEREARARERAPEDMTT